MVLHIGDLHGHLLSRLQVKDCLGFSTSSRREGLIKLGVP